MTYIGKDTCKSVEELRNAIEALRELPVEIYSAGLTITVTYAPKGEEQVIKAARIMAQITSVIEAIETHGISLLTEKGE